VLKVENFTRPVLYAIIVVLLSMEVTLCVMENHCARTAYNGYQDIVLSFYKFNKTQTATNDSLEKIRKKLKESTSSEGELVVQKNDYFLLIEQMAIENEKILNEKDPEIKNLFELLAGENSTINKNVLSNIIKDFELPISVEEFLKSAGKKEEINFSDFCSLFKSKNSGEHILKSLTTGYNSNSERENNPNQGFPIEVKKKGNLN